MLEHQDDIEKYLSGKMTNAARHRLEKKALSDPFLAEALEGAESVSSHEFSHDLDQIHQKINIQKRSSFFWPLRIAAGIIVVISITVVTIKLTESETSNQLALQKQNPAVEDPSASKKAVDPKIDATALVDEQQAPVSRETKSLPHQPIISEKPATSTEEAMPTADALSATPGETEQDQGEVEMNKEISADKIEVQKNELSKTIGLEEKIELTPATRERAASAPSSSRSLPLNKKSEAASGASVAKDDAPSAIGLNESPISPMPIGGMPQFNKYIEDNLRYPQRAVSNGIEGDVIVEFQINTNGSYRNFIIIKGLGNGCDEEAIRLIKGGPLWTPALRDGKVIDNKPRVTIPFRIKKTGN